MFRSKSDPIGFNPTQNQSGYGTPQVSPYGLAARRTPPMAAIDYYPSWPYKGQIDFSARQLFGGPQDNSLYAQSHGYRGILPVTAMPLINRPYPYQVRAVSPFNIG